MTTALSVVPDDAIFEAATGVRMTLPTGRILTAPRPLLFDDALVYLKALRDYQALGDVDALDRMLSEFPAKVGSTREACFGGLTLGECCDVVQRFFSLRRLPNGHVAPAALPAAPPTPAPAAPIADAAGG